MCVTFAFQNLAAQVMKTKSRPLYLHLAASSGATFASWTAAYIIFDVKASLSSVAPCTVL